MTERSNPTTSVALRWVGGIVVMAAALVLLVSGLQTSQAEVTASTSSSGLFSAGSVQLEQVSQAVELLFDEDLLYPGVSADACVEVMYSGSIPAEIRVFAKPQGGTGLDQFIRFELWATDQPCPADTALDTPVFDETLRNLWQDHGDYDRGIVLGPVESGGTRTLAARAELLDEPEAAGLYTDFAIVVEARP